MKAPLLKELQWQNADLQEQVNELRNNSILGQAQGENITLNDSSSARFSKIGISGNSKQETSSIGKNICPTNLNEWESGEYNTIGVKSVNTSRLRVNRLIQVKPNTTYYVNTDNSDYIFIIREFNSSKEFINNIGMLTNGLTFTTSESVCYIAVTICSNTGIDTDYSTYQTLFENRTLKPFICLNSETNKTYEDFIPDMPSIDYKSEIESCGDNVNLFDKDNVASGYYNGIGEIATSLNWCYQKIMVIGGKKIIASGNNYNNNIACFIALDENENYISTLGGYYELNSKVITLPDNAKYIGVSCHNNEKNTLKIEYGSVATPYSSYGQGSINEVVCNKNIFDFKKWINKGLSAVRGTVILKDNQIEITATDNDCYTATYGTVNPNNSVVEKYGMQVKPSTNYYFSFKKANNTLGLLYIFFYDKNKNYLSMINTNKTYLNFNTSKDAKYICIRLGINNSGDTEIFSDIQIEEGSVATDYVEHQEQVISIPVQQEMLEDDCLDFDNEKEVHVWKKYIFNGTETGWLYDSERNRFYMSLLDIAKPKPANGLSSHFKNGNTETDNNSFNLGSSQIFFRNENITSVDDWKTWLAEQNTKGTPLTVYYKLATPLKLDFTDAQKQAKKELEKLRSYKNITHIYSTDEISSIVDLTYVKDTETYLNNLETRIEELEVN